MAELYPCPFHYADAIRVEIQIQDEVYPACSGSKDILAQMSVCAHCEHREETKRQTLRENVRIETLVENP